jgi:hypothetical protein
VPGTETSAIAWHRSQVKNRIPGCTPIGDTSAANCIGRRHLEHAGTSGAWRVSKSMQIPDSPRPLAGIFAHAK